MFRGAFIFGSGLGVGYFVAMRNQEPNGEVKRATVDFIRTVKAIAIDAWLDAKNESKTEKVRAEGESLLCPNCGALL